MALLPETRPEDDGILTVDPPRGLALLSQGIGGVTFEGIALGAGAYVDAAGRRVHVRSEHLTAVAARMQGVFLRDLHREDLGASVGIVTAARIEGEEVRFTGDVRLAPYVDLIRHFGPHIRFSLGFRYDPAHLAAREDGSYDLPADFLVDHLALVPQGQYANARLVRLLNQARGLTSSLSKEPGDSTMPDDPTPEAMEQLRLQRDEALKAAKVSEAASEASRCELAKARADLEAATKLGDAVRLELVQAKNRFAAEVMKLELAVGKDFDLDQRKKDLTAMDLGALDRLRGELHLGAAREAAREAAEAAGGAAAPPATQADLPLAAGTAQRDALDLEALSFADTLRLAFQHGVV